MAHNKELKPIQLVALELSQGMLFQVRPPQAWGDVFGARRSRDAEGQVLAYDHDYYGVTGGYETDYNQARVGVLAGFAQSDVDTEAASIETDTDSFFAGGYGHFHLGPVNLTAALIGGYEDHDNDRLVLDALTGFEVAKADFDSFFLSPALTLSAEYVLADRLVFRPSVSLVYSVAWYDDYNESGTTRSNLSIDDRTVQALNGRLQLAAAYELDAGSELELRVGAMSRHTDEDDINANLAGTNFRYAAASDDSVYGGYLGANLRVAVQDRMNLTVDVEYGRATGGETQVSGLLGLEITF